MPSQHTNVREHACIHVCVCVETVCEWASRLIDIHMKQPSHSAFLRQQHGQLRVQRLACLHLVCNKLLQLIKPRTTLVLEGQLWIHVSVSDKCLIYAPILKSDETSTHTKTETETGCLHANEVRHITPAHTLMHVSTLVHANTHVHTHQLVHLWGDQGRQICAQIRWLGDSARSCAEAQARHPATIPYSQPLP
jgi:hypothetical protein